MSGEDLRARVVRGAASYLEARDFIEALEKRAGKAERELKAAQIVIGAAALSAGGLLRISRKAMTEVDHNGELSAWSEPDEIVYTYHAKDHPPNLRGAAT